MLRVVHSFDLQPGVVEESFINWLDGRLEEVTKRFGCLERKTWIFLDGMRGDYETGKPERRPKYLNEAFWPDQKQADQFRQWLLSVEGEELRQRWFSSVTNHTVLRYVEGWVPHPLTDE